MEPQNQNYLVFLWRHLTTGQRFGIGALLLLLLVFPIAVIVALMPTNPFSRAGSPATPTAGATTILSFSSPNITQDQNGVDQISVGLNKEFYADVVIDSQLNTVSAAQLRIGYPVDMLEVLSVELQDHLPTELESVDVTTDPGVAEIRFTVGSTAEEPKQGVGTLARIHLRSRGIESQGGLYFNEGTEVAAIGEDGNVLQFSRPVMVVVSQAPAPTPTPTEVPGVTPTPTDVPTPTPTEAPNSAQLDIKFNLNTVTGRANDLPLEVLLELDSCPDENTGCPSLLREVVASNGEDGTYNATVSNVELGSDNTYKVFIKPTGFLRKLVGTITLVAGSNLITGDPEQGGLNLVAGDLNGNGEVDIYDFTTVIEDFGLTNSPADFNRNGEVDIYDFTSVVEFFGTTGD